VVVEWLIAGARPPCWFNGINGSVLVAQIFIVQNLTQTFGSFAPSWSITNEMFYYVFYGALVSISLKSGVRAIKLGMIVCLVVAVPMDLLYFGWIRSRFVASVGLLFGLGTFWFLGAFVAEYREALKCSHLARSVSRSWPMVLATAIAMWCSQHVHLQVVYVVLAIAFTLMLIHIVSAEKDVAVRDERQRTSWLVTMLGLASYPTYLFHGPLLLLVGSAILRWRLVDDWRLTWLILVSVGISTGIALGYVAERPIMNWRAAFLSRFRAQRAPSARGDVKVPVLSIQQ
jgi:peptidoglycan/LPS O-acetylase OafA/YrhL